MRLLLAEHQAILRAGLRSFLANTQFRVVAEVDSPTTLILEVSRHQPQVVILDACLSGCHCLDVLHDLLLQFPALPTILWSLEESPSQLVMAKARGAVGFVSKGIAKRDMLATLKRVAKHGNAWTAEQVAIFEGATEIADNVAVHLTPRERQVLRHLSYGLSNKEIGVILGISYETVKEHVQHIFRKLNFSDRTSAAVWTIRNGLS